MQAKCGAKTKAGGSCGAPAMANGRCRVHGGPTPRGLACVHTKHGRYSGDLPTRLAARYEEAERDPELISLKSEISLVDARLADVLGRVDTKEAGIHWANAAKALKAFNAAMPGPDKDEAMVLLTDSIGEGLSDYAAWGEVLGLVERRRKLAETQMKTLSSMGQMISAERMGLMMGAIVDVIRKNVSNRDELAAISAGISQLAYADSPAH